MMSQKMSYADDEEMVKLAFRTLDKDGSGSISTTEFKHLMTHFGKYNFTVCRTIISYLREDWLASLAVSLSWPLAVRNVFPRHLMSNDKCDMKNMT